MVLIQAGAQAYNCAAVQRSEEQQPFHALLLQGLVADHVNHPQWGQHAQSMVNGSMWSAPRDGGHDDKVTGLQALTTPKLLAKCGLFVLQYAPTSMLQACCPIQ